MRKTTRMIKLALGLLLGAALNAAAGCDADDTNTSTTNNSTTTTSPTEGVASN